MAEVRKLRDVIAAAIAGNISEQDLRNFLYSFSGRLSLIKEQFRDFVETNVARNPNNPILVNRVAEFSRAFDKIEAALLDLNNFFVDGDKSHLQAGLDQMLEAANRLENLQADVREAYRTVDVREAFRTTS